MNSINRERVKELLHRAAQLSLTERVAFVEREAGSDLQIAAEVKELLKTVDDPAFMCAPTNAGLIQPPDHSIPPSEGPGSRIDHYKLLQLIGEGGFGRVFMAEQTKPVSRRVALKIIKTGMDTKNVIARFEAERQALALMDHPNIARVLDAGATPAGLPYFVMELVKGEPVTQYCDGARLSVRQRLNLFLDICHAVQHAHQKGIIHRDLKPPNVLVTVADGKPIPKVIDFGIAKATAGLLTDKTLFTEMHQLIGTPEYMSPEQAELSGVDIDTRSDVYALGVLLFELLTGGTPFDRKRLCSAPFVEMQRIIREEEPPRPSIRLQTLASSSGQARFLTPEGRLSASDSSIIEIAHRRRSEPPILSRTMRGDLDWIVMKCLEKERARRYETASAVADDVRRYLANEAVRACPPTMRYKLRKFVGRNRGTVLAGALICATLLAATGVSIAYAKRERIALLEKEEQRKAAEVALTRAVKAEREAKSRADDLEKVAKFQQTQLAGINVQAMGLRIRDDLIKKSRTAAERSKLTPDEVITRIEALEKSIAGSDFTSLALDALHDNFFLPALEVIQKEFAGQPLVKARLLQTLACTQRKLGLLDAAIGPQTEALAIRRRELGEEHYDTIVSIAEMGALLQAQGKLSEAEPYHRESLEKFRRVLGEENPVTLASIDNMGLLLHAQGKLTEAGAHHAEALEKRRRVLGKEHPDMLTSINNMALLLHDQGRQSEAEAYWREALEIRRRIQGTENPETLTSINNLAELLRRQGKLAEAEPLLREALEQRRRVLGAEHPDTLISIGNMGALFWSQYKLSDAEPYCREALATGRRVQGDDHPDTLLSINNMGMLLKAMGKLEEAQTYFGEAMEKRRRLLGDEHPDTITSIDNMGSLLQLQGQQAEAEAYVREALDKRRRVLGDEHPDTLTSIGRVGSLLRAQYRFAEAEPYYRETLEKRRRTMGDEHIETLIAMGNLGGLLQAEGKLAEAEPLLREAMEKCRRLLGEENPNTLISIINFGSLLQAQSNATEAIALLAPVEPGVRKSFTGGNAVRLGRLLTALGRARATTGEFQEAQTNLNEAHDIFSKVKSAADLDRKAVLSGLVELYTAWQAAQPDNGHDADAAKSRAELELRQSTSQPTNNR